MSQAWGDRDPDLLSVNEAAAILRRGPGFVRGLIESGCLPDIPHLSTPNYRRISRNTLQRFIEGQL